jgi:uncharacterized membrane protein
VAQFNISLVIDKPIKIVYQAYIDPENMMQWTKDLEKFEIIKGKFGEIGATARLHYNQKGSKSILEDKLEYLEPGKKIVSQVTGGGLKARVETAFISGTDKTELFLIWNGKGNNIFITFILAILKKKIKSQARSELDKFKVLVEKFGVKFK